MRESANVKFTLVMVEQTAIRWIEENVPGNPFPDEIGGQHWGLDDTGERSVRFEFPGTKAEHFFGLLAKYFMSPKPWSPDRGFTIEITSPSASAHCLDDGTTGVVNIHER